MALRTLHFLMSPLEMSILTHIVHFHRLYFASMTLNFLISDKVFKYPFQSSKYYSSSFYTLSVIGC